MNTDCKLIWESYELLTELAVSKANVQRLITKYGIDEPAARSLINRFNEVEGALAKKDIFTYNNIDELKAAIGAVTTEREKVTKGAINVFENDFAIVLLIRTKEASIKHGRGTKWCISYDEDEEGDEGDDGNAFVRYAISSSVFFVISKTDKEKFAIITNTDGSYKEIKNKNNEEVPIQPILSKYNLRKSIFKYIPYTVQELKNIILSTPDSAIQYAVDVIKGRWPEAESIIMKNPYVAVSYAVYVIKGRWPEAESNIMKDPQAAVGYAVYVIKGRWPEAESNIMRDPYAAVEYAIKILKGRWPEAESSIMEMPYSAMNYVRDILKRRWPEAESIIMKDPYVAVEYARDVIKGRWPEAESSIMENPNAAMEYARDVIKGRWPEAESNIMKNPHAAAMYSVHVLKQ